MIVRTTRVLLEVLAASLLGIMLLTGGAAWRLSQGPVPLNFLSPHFEAALNGQGAPFRVTLEKTILAWAGWERTLDIRIVDVRARAEDGRLIAQVPEISVSVSVRALLRGVVAPTSLDFIGSNVQMVRRKSGELALTFGDLEAESEDNSGSAVFTRLVEVLGAEPSPDRPASYLRRVSILDAGFRIDDRSTGVVWGAPETNIILLREAGEIHGTFITELDIGGSATRISGSATWRPESDTVRIESEFSGVRTDRIAAKLPFLKGLEALRLDVSGAVGMTLSLDGDLRAADFDLVAANGQITYSAIWPEGLPVKSARVQGTFDGDAGSVEIEKLTANLNGPVLSGTSTVLRLGEGLAIDGVLAVDRMTLGQLNQYWPRNLGNLPRQWVAENMPSGLIENTRANLSLRIPDLRSGEMTMESFAGKLRFRDTTIQYVKGLPPVRKMEATAVFSHDRFIATIRSGVADKLKVKSASVRLTKLDTNNQQSDIDVVVEGRLEDALSMIDRPPLGFVSQLGMQPKGVAGQTRTNLNFSFPIDRSIDLSHVRIRGRSELTDIGVPNFAFGKSIAADRLSLIVDKAGLTLSGDAVVGSVPARIKWTERFNDKEPFKRRYEAKAVLNEEGRRAMGLPDLSPYVSGPVAADLSYLESIAGKRELALKVALADSTLWLPGFRWRKAAGRDGLLWLTVDIKPDGKIDVRQFDFKTATLSASGNMTLDKGNNLLRASVDSFALGRTRVSGTVKPHADGGLNIELTGPEFDAAVFLDDEDTSEQELPSPPNLHISAKLDKVWIDKTIALSRTSGRLVGNATGWQTVDVTGYAGAKNQIKLFYAVAPVPQLNVTATDAGQTFRALEILDTIQGGNLTLMARKSNSKKPDAWVGTLDVTNFVMVRAPVLAKVLTNLSLTGIQNNLAGKGIQFAKLDIPFVYENELFTMNNARSVGSELGITGEGTIDRKSDSITLKGTIVPAYTINSVLGNIPLLGALFTGKKGSGVFAATYRISGSIREPKISVNPLAALAPGFLRNLIGIFDGSVKPDASKSSTIPDTN